MKMSLRWFAPGAAAGMMDGSGCQHPCRPDHPSRSPRIRHQASASVFSDRLSDLWIAPSDGRSLDTRDRPVGTLLRLAPELSQDHLTPNGRTPIPADSPCRLEFCFPSSPLRQLPIAKAAIDRPQRYDQPRSYGNFNRATAPTERPSRWRSTASGGRLRRDPADRSYSSTNPIP